MVHVFTQKMKWLVIVCAALAAASSFAQESAALLNALIRKGILTSQEAEDIRAELRQENKAIPPEIQAGGKHTDRLSVGMRIQAQYAHLDTDIRGVTDPAPTHHAFLRRIYLSLKAGLGPNWGASMTYDLAASGFDDAIIEWKPAADLTFNFGLRKVNVAYEERATSGHLRSIERSGVTRYFVEPNNGRRLGAASYRIGVFLDGKQGMLVYSAAVTTPERNETFNLAASAGDRTSNKPAGWANVGLAGKHRQGTWIAGVGAGHLPDQGGFGRRNLGRGSDLSIYSVYVDLTAGRMNFMGELLTAQIDQGTASGADAQPLGFFLQPSLMLTDMLEAVVRYQHLDTDGRGVNLSDVVRSAPAGGAMNEFSGWYAGANWYLKGNNLKYQLGLVYGETRDGLTDAAAEAKTFGVRSQMQLQF